MREQTPPGSGRKGGQKDGWKESFLTGDRNTAGRVPGLSNTAEGVIHLQEKLPGNVLESQQVLSKQRLGLDSLPQRRLQAPPPGPFLGAHLRDLQGPIPEAPKDNAKLS